MFILDLIDVFKYLAVSFAVIAVTIIGFRLLGTSKASWIGVVVLSALLIVAAVALIFIAADISAAV